MQETLIVINGFVHDLSTGIWLGALLLLGRLSAKTTQLADQFQIAFVGSLSQDLSNLAFISLAIMLITGIIRAFTLKAYGWSGDVAPGRKRLLYIKHTILGILVLLGVLFQVSLLP